MKSINFDTGIRTYSLNGDETNVISINVADPNLEARIERAKTKIDSISDKFNDFGNMTAEEKESTDKEVKKLIDDTFNSDISVHAFGETSCLALLASGKFLFESFFDAFVPVIMNDIEKVSKSFAEKSAERMNEYISAAVSAENDDAE